MSSRQRHGLIASAIGIVVIGILFSAFRFSRPQNPVRFEPTPRRIASGSDPTLAIRDTGDVYLLKLEGGNLLYEISGDGGDSFGRGVRVNDVDGEVISHAEAAPRLYLRGGKPYAVWQAHVGSDLESTKLRFSRSTDYGRSFSKAIDVDPSGPASQSFFTMNVSPKGAIYVAWLDGRDHSGGHMDHGGSGLYIARSTDGGASFEKSVRVALNVCPCCRPSIAFTDDGTVHVSFRQVFENNVRDIVVATSTDGGKAWASPVRVADDHWQINGCPHSGPSLAVIGNRLFVSWFTVHDKEQRSFVFLAHSDDRGRTFSDRVSLSDGTLDPNHPSLISANDRLFAVFQGREDQAKGNWGKVRVFVREITASSSVSPLVSVANLQTSAAYPTLAFESPEKVFVVWTESDDSGASVVLARGRLNARGM